MVHDVQVHLVPDVQVEGVDPGRTLEENVVLLLLVHQLRRDVKDVLAAAQRTVQVLWRGEIWKTTLLHLLPLIVRHRSYGWKQVYQNIS